MLRDLLIAEGFRTGRRHVATLMKRMGIQAVYRKPNTSQSAPGHRIYPYLLRNLPVTRPNQGQTQQSCHQPPNRSVDG
jgi:putative transposase